MCSWTTISPPALIFMVGSNLEEEEDGDDDEEDFSSAGYPRVLKAIRGWWAGSGSHAFRREASGRRDREDATCRRGA